MSLILKETQINKFSKLYYDEEDICKTIYNINICIYNIYKHVYITYNPICLFLYDLLIHKNNILSTNKNGKAVLANPSLKKYIYRKKIAAICIADVTSEISVIFMPTEILIFPFVDKLLKHIKRIKNLFCVTDKSHIFCVDDIY